MAPTGTLEYLADSLVPLRNAPVQARSTARLTALLDAAAAVVDEIGFERLTTAMVADRAGASIGTVYRYFPDRIALLQALASRNLERVLTRAADEIVDPRHADWVEAMAASFDVFAEAFRSEPGFRGLRVGDVIDLRPAANERPFNSIVANRLLDGLISRFGVPDSDEIRLRFEAAIEVTDALVARAFARDARGDEAFLAVARETSNSMLSEYFGAV